MHLRRRVAIIKGRLLERMLKRLEQGEKSLQETRTAAFNSLKISKLGTVSYAGYICSTQCYQHAERITGRKPSEDE